MSKERARNRAAREAAALADVSRARRQSQRRAASAGRRERWAMRWRQTRLWQRGPATPLRRRRREVLGIVASAVLLALVLVWTTTRSVSALVAAVLVCLVGAPVLTHVLLERSDR